MRLFKTLFQRVEASEALWVDLRANCLDDAFLTAFFDFLMGKSSGISSCSLFLSNNAFRGASLAYILEILHHFPNLASLTLDFQR